MADFGTNAEDAPVLRFADVSRVHEAGASRVVSLEHADLTLHAGEFVAIMGPSGSGKSTLLNLAGGLDLPTEGRVFVDGVDLTKLDMSFRITIFCRHLVQWRTCRFRLSWMDGRRGRLMMRQWRHCAKRALKISPTAGRRICRAVRLSAWPSPVPWSVHGGFC